MKPLIALLLVCVCTQAIADTYRWVDDDGQVHYSDRPHEGAVKVEVGSAQTYSQPKPAAGGTQPARRSPSASESQAPAYASLRVVRPAPQETYRNIGGQLPVTLSINPGLRPGHGVRVYYDGMRVENWPPDMLSFTLTDVFRGEHNLRAAVVDSQGRELASSETVTFYVHQTSIQNRRGN